MISIRTWAVAAGVALLLMAALVGFGNFAAIEGLVTWGDAGKTAQDIAASEGLFRAGVASLFLVVVLDVVIACALYRVFTPVDRTMSLLAAAFRLVYAAVFMVALGYLLDALRHVDQQVLSDVEAFSDLWTAGLGLFGAHLLLLGYLAFRASYVPSWLGILLAIAGLGYLGVFFGQDLTISTYTFIGELLLAFWLVLRGRRIPTTFARGFATADQAEDSRVG
ncbi:uncharacterized protein DUF4386 [Kribbella steppae]|uniref:Uncharacterized protein DUF4386 n=1 Tax=Kribbella steppae TaxID=2512223 RepID=A0A4R2HMC2_9ACTN|nr:DUF4386 domain-containing protein [Kribbella steppae]TCO32421.1 uncharacterized protein DUF4386 [Kribbella steppae]